MTSCKRPARNASNDARPFKPCKSIKGNKDARSGAFSRMVRRKGYGFIQPDDAEKERVFCISKILHALDLGQLLAVHWNIW